MKIYAKIGNGNLVYPPREHLEGGYIYTPPREAQIIALGFKPVVDNRPAESLQEGYWWKPSCSETEEEIIISYTQEKMEISEQVNIAWESA